MKKCLFIFAMLLMAGFAFAEELTVTVEQAVELAMQNNIQVKQAGRTLASAERANKNSWNSVSPSLSANVQMQIPLMEKQREMDVNYSVSISGSASLRLHPSLYSSIKGAKLQLEQGQITYEDALRSVELNVRKIFYSLILSEQTIETQKRSVEAAKRQYETNLAKYNRGQLSELDLFSSQVNYESKMPAVESQENQLVNSMESFKQLLGVNRDVKLNLKGSLEGFEKFDEEKVQINLSNSSAIKKIEKQIEAAENQLLATRFSAWGPSLSASYQVGVGNAMGNTSGAMATGRKNIELSSHAISLGVSIPLDGYLPWTTGPMNIANQKDSLETLKESLEAQKRTTQLSIENSLRTIRQAQSQMKSLEGTVALAQKTYDLTQNAYNQGSRDLNSLRNAEDSLISAKTQLQSQNYTLVNAILELENTLGVPFGTLSK
ncbi:MAG: TolC family protein [Treponema sp.]|nr:TolC family protein [Treponema sp.]